MAEEMRRTNEAAAISEDTLFEEPASDDGQWFLNYFHLEMLRYVVLEICPRIVVEMSIAGQECVGPINHRQDKNNVKDYLY